MSLLMEKSLAMDFKLKQYVFWPSSLFCSFIYELLERAHLTYKSKAAVYEALEQISGYLAGRQYSLMSLFFY